MQNVLLAITLASISVAHAGKPIALTVDARDISRKIVHVREVVPAKAGPFVLVYPKWYPGGHTPAGPVENVVGLRVSAGGKTVAWKRDPLDMYAFQIEVPAGADKVEVEFDLLTVPGIGGRQAIAPTAQQAIIEWFNLILYPQGSKVHDLHVAATLKLPAGWKWGSALAAQKEGAGGIEFKPVSLETLVDSPVISGTYFKALQLTTPPDGVWHGLDLVADSAAALEAPADLLAGYGRLVGEGGALFGSRHYKKYTFLLSLSDVFGRGGGLEHHESSDNRLPERALIDEAPRKRSAGLLPHEFAHSWNGKFRRPQEIATPDFQAPMQDGLLWVYEGLTTYLGDLLTARSGLRTREQARDQLALAAADMDHRPGRAWRPLEDTATGAPVTYGTPEEGSSYRRGVDFYPEGELVWLEADTIIRKLTGGKRSLDDFCRRFHGGQGGEAALKPYTFEDVVSALNETAPFDWKTHLRERLSSTAVGAPMGGIEAAGWKLAYDETPNEVMKALEETGKQVILRHSIGVTLKEDGTVIDAIPGMASAKAGLAPGMKVVAVKGRKYSGLVMHEAVRASKGEKGPIELIVENGEFFSTVKVDWRGGEKIPHLVRDKGKADLLEAIWTPLLAPAKTPVVAP